MIGSISVPVCGSAPPYPTSQQAAHHLHCKLQPRAVACSLSLFPRPPLGQAMTLCSARSHSLLRNVCAPGPRGRILPGHWPLAYLAWTTRCTEECLLVPSQSSLGLLV